MKIDYEAIVVIFGLGLLFGFSSLVASLDLTTFLTGFGSGAFLGFAGLPHIDSEKWRPRPLVCALLASFVVTALALGRGDYPYPIAFYTITGFIAGYFAPYASKYL